MKEREKLTHNLGGVRNMQRPPDAVFFVDLKIEAIGVREAERLKIPIIAPGRHQRRPGSGASTRSRATTTRSARAR